MCDFEGMVAVGSLSSGLAYALRHAGIGHACHTCGNGLQLGITLRR
ncbi:hypothetical protein ACFQ88_32090 [Paenibacillus sp. NPDC056579]|nr:hypothetical protein [Paenibacillus sp. H1-7]